MSSVVLTLINYSVCSMKRSFKIYVQRLHPIGLTLCYEFITSFKIIPDFYEVSISTARIKIYLVSKKQ